MDQAYGGDNIRIAQIGLHVLLYGTVYERNINWDPVIKLNHMGICGLKFIIKSKIRR